MRITDLLQKNSIRLGAAVSDKNQAIDLLIDLQCQNGSIADRAVYKNAILARESQGSTAVGDGIAIPHAKSDTVKHPALAAMTVPGGVDYAALDGKPSNLFFMTQPPMTATCIWRFCRG